MPSKWRVKRIFGPLVKVMAQGLGKLGISPNGATWIMLCSSILSIIMLNVTRLEWVFGLLVFFTGIMDGVDGNIARQFNKTTKTGEFFDSFSDRLSEIILSLGALLYFMGQGVKIGVTIESWIGYMIMGSIMVSYVRARAALIVKGDYDKGLFARSERLFTIFIFSIFGILEWGIIVVAIGANITAFYRVYEYRKMLKISGPIPVSS
jgi:phosphatidylglycerophosphate synthase